MQPDADDTSVLKQVSGRRWIANILFVLAFLLIAGASGADGDGRAGGESGASPAIVDLFMVCGLASAITGVVLLIRSRHERPNRRAPERRPHQVVASGPGSPGARQLHALGRPIAEPGVEHDDPGVATVEGQLIDLGICTGCGAPRRVRTNESTGIRYLACSRHPVCRITDVLRRAAPDRVPPADLIEEYRQATPCVHVDLEPTRALVGAAAANTVQLPADEGGSVRGAASGNFEAPKGDSASDSPRSAHRSVTEALTELNELRLLRLVDGDEYEAKRVEILGRL